MTEGSSHLDRLYSGDTRGEVGSVANNSLIPCKDGVVKKTSSRMWEGPSGEKSGEGERWWERGTTLVLRETAVAAKGSAGEFRAGRSKTGRNYQGLTLDNLQNRPLLQTGEHSDRQEKTGAEKEEFGNERQGAKSGVRAGESTGPTALRK